MPVEMHSNLSASFYRKRVVEMEMQQIKNGHSNKYFIEIVASVRIGKYSSRSFLRIFLDLASCSVHEPTKKNSTNIYFSNTDLTLVQWQIGVNRSCTLEVTFSLINYKIFKTVRAFSLVDRCV